MFKSLDELEQWMSFYDHLGDAPEDEDPLISIQRRIANLSRRVAALEDDAPRHRRPRPAPTGMKRKSPRLRV